MTIHGAERIGDRVGLWMELVRGQTLEQQLRRGTAFNAADTIAIGIELCGAVAAVHAAGLLHRDIKAHNVMRAEDGRVVLMDFGAGRELDDSSSSDLTGTPLYLAPEVLRGEPATVQSDLYCLGVLLYHLLTGKYPVEGRTIQDVRAAHEQGRRTTLKTARPDLPPALVRVIDRAIDPDPRARYQSAGALAAELKALTVSPWARRLKYIAAAAAVLVVAAGVALGTPGWRPFGPPKGRRGWRCSRSRTSALSPARRVRPRPELRDPEQSAQCPGHLAAFVLGVVGVSREGEESPADCRRARRGLHPHRLNLSCRRRPSRSMRSSCGSRTMSRIWTESFGRKIADVFAVQDDISKAIVDELRAREGLAEDHTRRAPISMTCTCVRNSSR